MRTILVVDDDPDVLDAMELYLESSYAVRVACDGRAALDLIEREQVDAVVLDLMMPVMDGASFMQELSARGRSVPVIVSSARPDAAEIAARLGAAEALTKPYEVDALERALSRLFTGDGSGGPRRAAGGSEPGPAGGGGAGGVGYTVVPQDQRGWPHDLMVPPYQIKARAQATRV